MKYARSHLLELHYQSAVDKVEIDFFLHKITLLTVLICDYWKICNCYQRAVIFVLILIHYEPHVLRDIMLQDENHETELQLVTMMRLDICFKSFFNFYNFHEDLSSFYFAFSVAFSVAVSKYFLNVGDALNFLNLTFGEFKYLSRTHRNDGSCDWARSSYGIGRTCDGCNKIYRFKLQPPEGR